MYVVYIWQTLHPETSSAYAWDITPAGRSNDSLDPGGLTGIYPEWKEWKQSPSVKHPKAEHGRSERNKYPYERRDTQEDEPSGEHLCLNLHQQLEAKQRQKTQKWCKLFFSPARFLWRQGWCDQSLSTHSYLTTFKPQFFLYLKY